MPPAPAAPSPADVRRKLEEGLGMARVAAESGVGVAKGVAGGGFDLARGLAGGALQGFGTARPGASSAAPAAPSPPPAPTPPPAPSPAASSAPTPPVPPISASPPLVTNPASAPDVARQPTSDNGGQAEPAPSVDTLAIPDYDELSASQVVERLDGLDRSSLDAIRRYEAAHRGRNTILGKIAQLS
jgi:hypothetical protein